MYESFIQEIVEGEGEIGVVLIDTQWNDLIIYTDKWGKYPSNIPNTESNIDELKSSLEAAGFLVVICSYVKPSGMVRI